MIDSLETQASDFATEDICDGCCALNACEASGEKCKGWYELRDDILKELEVEGG